MSAMLDSRAVAEKAGVKIETIHYYHKRGMMPPADQYYGRSPVWSTTTIDEWLAARRRSPRTEESP